MKSKSILFFVFFVSVLLSLPAYGETTTLSDNAINSTAVDVKINGIKDVVVIRRDKRGIPYIEAKNDDDLYFAQGYVTASDRLWQMDLFRRVAGGETAEIFGRQALEEDKRWRNFGFTKIAAATVLLMKPDIRRALENYARGVNAYIATLDEKSLPVEFRILQYRPRNWAPTDTLLVGKILSDSLSSTWRGDLIFADMKNSLTPKKFSDLANSVTPLDVILFGNDKAQPARKAPVSKAVQVSSSDLAFAEKDAAVRESSLSRIGFYAEELAASNNWVISGKRTLDGKPILSNDPHLQASAPGIWYMAHLSAPGVSVSGVTLPGSPAIVLGHNESLAWGATNVGPDVQDVYLETFNAEGKYKTPDGWKTPEVRTEKIRVRKNPTSTETEDESLVVTETRNGVIINTAQAAGTKGGRYALKWTARDSKNEELSAFYELNRARNWTDFRNALRSYGGATQNFVYADIRGNIGWIAAGVIPLRKTGDGTFPYDGATSDGDWTGNIPFDELPTLYNPPSGFIVTANQRIVGTSYKYPQMTRAVAAPWRAAQIQKRLAADKKMTVDKVADVLFDSTNLALADFVGELLKLKVLKPENDKLFRSWQLEGFKMTPESQGALLGNDIRVCVGAKINEENPTVPAYIARERLMWMLLKDKPAEWLPKKFKNYGEMVTACETETETALAKRHGNDRSKWVWGTAFMSRFQHPLAAVPLIGAQFNTPNVPIHGSGQSPNVGSAVSLRHIAVPGDWDKTSVVIPLGNSGDPKSPHWKDLFEIWSTGKTNPVPFSNEAITKAAVSTVRWIP